MRPSARVLGHAVERVAEEGDHLGGVERIVAGGDDEREHVLGAATAATLVPICLAGGDIVDRLGAGERGEDRLAPPPSISGSIATMVRPTRPLVHHRLDDAAEHRLAGDVDEAFVGDAAGLGQRIEIAAARRQHERGIARVRSWLCFVKRRHQRAQWSGDGAGPRARRAGRLRDRRRAGPGGAAVELGPELGGR